MNDDSRSLLRLLSECSGRIFGTLIGVAAGLIAVYYGFGKALVFAFSVVAGYGLGRLFEQGELVRVLLTRVSVRRRR